MKRLLLVLLLSATAIAAGKQTPELAAFDMCGSGQVYRAVYYYQYSGGPECGLTYQYCDGTPRYHEGCTTSYYDQSFFCECQ
jgi:hypothetical protein